VQPRLRRLRKIQYPQHVLAKRLTPQQCFDAVEECGAPMVSIPGGEPLIHPEIKEIVEGLVARKKYIYLCTNALLLKRRLEEGVFKPPSTSPSPSTSTARRKSTIPRLPAMARTTPPSRRSSSREAGLPRLHEPTLFNGANAEHVRASSMTPWTSASRA